MDAIILAAGKGTRISEITDGKPKSFLEINGKRIIDWQLHFLREAGIKRIILVVGYRKELFYELYGNCDDITLVFNPFYESTGVLPSFWFGINHLSDDTLFLHADTIFDKEILQKLIKTEGDIVLPIDKKLCVDEDMKVIIENDIIKTISKEIPCNTAHGEFIGVAKISKHTLPFLKQTTDNILTTKEFLSFFEKALQVGSDNGHFNLTPLDITGLAWNEIDFYADYEKAKSLFNNRDLKID